MNYNKLYSYPFSNKYNDNKISKEIIYNVNTENEYLISINNKENITLIITNALSIILPISSKENNNSYIKIINKTDNVIPVYSNNEEFIFSAFFTQRNGNLEVYLKNKSITNFYNINENDKYSWIMT